MDLGGGAHRADHADDGNELCARKGRLVEVVLAESAEGDGEA